MKKLLIRLLRDEYAGSSVEWILVTGASFLLFSALAYSISTIIAYIFTRSEIIISTPFG